MRIIYALVPIALILAQTPFARATEQVDLLLALAMDVSRSMDQPKFLLQREGYAAQLIEHSLGAARVADHPEVRKEALERLYGNLL